jgi:hypothetical protein
MGKCIDRDAPDTGTDLAGYPANPKERIPDIRPDFQFKTLMSAKI